MKVYLSVEQVLALHQAQVDGYGGAPGLRDVGGLESAVARPRMTFGGEDLYKDAPEKAAAIRAVWHEMGRKARPRDVIAALSSSGMKITSSEVIGVRDRMFKRRRKAATGGAVVAG